MCGIAAIYRKNGINGEDKVLLNQMSEKIKHRGPDGKGIFFDHELGLAHRRLSIIDRSNNGSQPMTYRDRYTIVYNGELYNYIEIRNKLLQKGYAFLSDSDTEVLLAAYDFYGIECLKFFNGMWAFILYDKKENRLIISRDRFGVKPLFYYKNSEYILFASEIKAILCDDKLERIANDELVYDFLNDSLLDHTNETFFKGIYKIPASSFLILSLDDPFNWKFENYYSVDFGMEERKVTIRKAAKAFRKLFHDSVCKRLRSDVLVGSCLSGGLDSSSIVTELDKIVKKRDRKLHTFSFCPEDKMISEKEYVKAVEKYTDIIPHYIDDKSFDLEKDFNKLIKTQDEPFSSMSIFASYLVYKAARANGIIVLLDGQGADEILCGYRKSRIYYIKKLLRDGKYFAALKEFLYSYSQIRTGLSVKSDISKIKKIIGINRDFHKITYIQSSFLQNHKSKQLYQKDNFQNTDVKKISLPVLLRYADRNSMAASVESRLPFLDYRIVDLCAAFPLSFKIRHGYSKYIMRVALDMPQKVKYRKNKYGFNIPQKEWMRKYSDYFKSFFGFEDFRAGKYINNQLVLRDWDKLINGRDNDLLFRMLSVTAWMKCYKVRAESGLSGG